MSSLQQRAKQVFLDALEHEGCEREAYLEQALGEQALGEQSELGERVRALLEAHDQADERLGLPELPSESSVVPGARTELVAGEQVDAYTLVERIGTGGFGDVWLAEQELPLRRQVAFKVLKVGMDTHEVVARFELERQALAIMDHPCIAKIFGAGETPLGRPYFVMELVDGLPILEYCNVMKLGTRRRVRLMLEVCGAIQHAHQKGVIHRDIKPSNVLVGGRQGEALPKVIDFGIAKALRSVAAEGAVQTRQDQIIGTPGFMSPEQFDETLDVDTRADVYSLGALLYELLVGCPPLELSSSNLFETRDAVCHQEPKRPSTRAALRLQEGAALAHAPSERELRGDLDWIVMRCLEKQRDERYASVGALAEDLTRYLAGEAVLAGPRTFGYRASKALRRHWQPILAGAVMLAMLVMAVLLTSMEARRADAAKRLADQELVRASAVGDFLRSLIMGIDPATTRGKDTELLQQIFQSAGDGVEEASAGLPRVEAELRTLLGHAHYSIGMIPEAEQYFRRALEIREAEQQPDAQLLVESLDNYGTLLAESGDYPQAKLLLERAVEAQRELHGIDDPLTQSALVNLAAVLQHLGELTRAEALLREVEQLQAESLAADHKDRLRTMNNLAVVLVKLDRLDEARGRYEFILEQQLATLSLKHPRTLSTMNNLAGLLDSLGEKGPAEELYRRALDAKLELLPAGHPGILIGKSNLAHFLVNQGRLEEASELRLEALASAREHLGLANRYTLTLLQTHGVALIKEGDPAGAEVALRSVHEEVSAVLGADSALGLSASSSLADALLQLERPAEALQILQPILPVYAEVFPGSAFARKSIPALHGLILAGLGREQEARALLEPALEALEEERRGSWIERVEAALAELGE